jgi:hypothetical protein
MSASANEALVRLVIDAIWNKGDLDVADELFGPDYVNHDCQIADLLVGPETVKLTVAFYRLAFPDLHITVEFLSASRDTVVVCWSASRGPPPGIDVAVTTNRRLLTGITSTRVAGGQIVETWTEWDRA